MQATEFGDNALTLNLLTDSGADNKTKKLYFITSNSFSINQFYSFMLVLLKYCILSIAYYYSS